MGRRGEFVRAEWLAAGGDVAGGGRSVKKVSQSLTAIFPWRPFPGLSALHFRS